MSASLRVQSHFTKYPQVTRFPGTEHRVSDSIWPRVLQHSLMGMLARPSFTGTVDRRNWTVLSLMIRRKDLIIVGVLNASPDSNSVWPGTVLLPWELTLQFAVLIEGRSVRLASGAARQRGSNRHAQRRKANVNANRAVG